MHRICGGVEKEEKVGEGSSGLPIARMDKKVSGNGYIHFQASSSP